MEKRNKTILSGIMFFRLAKEGFLFAVNSIIVNKLRTFLSLFGITIGIFAIISVFTVLDWMESSIKDSIATLGDDVVYIQKFPWSFDPDLQWWDILAWPQPDMDDYETIKKRSSKVEATNYSVSFNRNLKYLGKQVANATILATTHELEDIRNFEIENGRYFSMYESSSGRPVAVIGHTTANAFFEKANPVGKHISIGGHKTTIIGVFKKEGQSSIIESLDEQIVIPILFSRNIVNLRNPNTFGEIAVKAREGVSEQELSDELIQVLRASRRLHPSEKSDFSINRASMLSQGLESVFVGVNVGGWIIGGFSILVGGFGIANIMFVSVKERTSIIGIQKALGAKRRFIMWQFLYESILLSIIGGLVGLFLIFIGTQVINYLYDLSIHLTMGNVFMAILISGTIGVVAGYTPAYKAAKMNPVDAISFSF